MTSTYAQLVGVMLAGLGSSVGTVLLTKLNAAVLTRARVARVLAVIGGVATALSTGQLDDKLVADQALPLVVNVLGTVFASHGWWKVLVQPQIEAGEGAVAALARRTASFGVGRVPPPVGE